MRIDTVNHIDKELASQLLENLNGTDEANIEDIMSNNGANYMKVVYDQNVPVGLFVADVNREHPPTDVYNSDYREVVENIELQTGKRSSWLWFMWLADYLQGQGIGTKLYNEFRQAAKNTVIFVPTDDSKDYEWYEHRGLDLVWKEGSNRLYAESV